VLDLGLRVGYEGVAGYVPVIRSSTYRNRITRIERLEQDRDALLSHYSQIAAEHLDKLDPEERNHLYNMLDLKVLAQEDGDLEVRWVLGGNLCKDNEPLPPGSCRTRGT
jgi:hypothetical protein